MNEPTTDHVWNDHLTGRDMFVRLDSDDCCSAETQ